MTIKTTDDFLVQLKSAITMPASQNRYTDEDLLAYGDECVQSNLVPMLLSLREEYLVTSSIISLDGSSSYVVPYRAVGRTLRDVLWRDSANNDFSLTYIAPEKLEDYNYLAAGQAEGFTLEADEIRIVPNNVTSGSLVLKYYLRPSEMVKPIHCARITAINTATGVVTCSSVPTDIEVGSSIDFVSKRYGTVLNLDVSIANKDSTNLTFNAADLPSRLAVGDYICTAEETCILPVPQECLPYLVFCTAERVLEAQGDLEALQAMQVRTRRAEDTLTNLMSPRVKGEAKILSRSALLGRRGRNLKTRI